MKYYLDTNIIIYALKGQYPAIREHFRRTPPAAIMIPSVVMAEIEFGARKSRDYNRTIALYRRFTDAFGKAPFSEKAQAVYGEIRAALEERGEPIGANDLLIAATVLADEGTLVANNVKEFSRVPLLHLENWTQ